MIFSFQCLNSCYKKISVEWLLVSSLKVNMSITNIIINETTNFYLINVVFGNIWVLKFLERNEA